MNAPTNASQATSRRCHESAATAVESGAGAKCMPAACAPRSSASSSPTCNARLAATPSRSSASRNARGSGFGTPASADVTTASKCSRRPSAVQPLGQGAVPVRDDGELQAARLHSASASTAPSPAGRRGRRGTRRRTPRGSSGAASSRRKTLDALAPESCERLAVSCRCGREGGSGRPRPRRRGPRRTGSGRRRASRAPATSGATGLSSSTSVPKPSTVTASSSAKRIGMECPCEPVETLRDGRGRREQPLVDHVDPARLDSAQPARANALSELLQRGASHAHVDLGIERERARRREPAGPPERRRRRCARGPPG